jgi:hypothetical protein
MWAGYSFCVPVTLNNHPSSTLTDFPVLFCANGATGAFCDSVAHSTLVLAGFKTTGNGGAVTSSSGYDIRPFTDVTCSTAITGFELVAGTYVASTGAFEMWIKIASLSSSADTTIYIGYGNSAVTTDGSSTATFASPYKRVYHLPNGSSLTTPSPDSTGNLNCNPGAGGSAPTAVGGQLDGGGHFVRASSQYINCAGTGLPTSGALTVSAWMKATTSLEGFFVSWGAGGNPNIYFGFNNAGDGKFYIGDVPSFFKSASTVNDGNWHYLVVTSNGGTSRKLYLDGALNNSDANSLTGGTTGFAIGDNQNSLGTVPYGGDMDEVRIVGAALTADWIDAEYKSQKEPWNFYTIGTPVAVGGGVKHRALSN